MSTLISNIRRGQTKPYASVPRIDWSHPLTAGLLFYHYDTPAGGYDLAGNRPWSLITANKIPVASTKWGKGHVFPSSTTDGIQYTSDAKLRILPPMSWACGCSRAVAASEANAAFFGRAANNGTSAPGFNWGFVDFFGGTTNSMGAEVNSSGVFTDSAAGIVLGLNAFHTLVSSAPSTTNYDFYADGKFVVNTGSLTIQDVTTGDNIFIGTDTGGPGNFQGQVYWGGFWNRTLTAAEALQLHLDPYCFLIYPEDGMFETLVGTSAAPAQIVEQNFFDVVQPRRQPAASYNFVQGPFSGTAPALSGTFATSPFFESVKLKQPVINISDITPAEPIKLAGEKWFDPLQLKRPSIDNAPILFQSVAITANIVEQPFFEPIRLKPPSEFTQGPYAGTSPALSGTFATSPFFHQIRLKQPIIDKPSDLPPLVVVINFSAANWFDALQLRRPTVEGPQILRAMPTGTVIEQAFFEAIRLKQPIIDNAPILFQPAAAATSFIVEQPFFDAIGLKRPSEFLQGPFAGTSPALTNAYVTQALFDQIRLKQPIIDRPNDVFPLTTVAAVNFSATNWFEAVKLFKVSERFGEALGASFQPGQLTAWFDSWQKGKIPGDFPFTAAGTVQSIAIQNVPSAWFDAVQKMKVPGDFPFTATGAIQPITIQNALVDWFVQVKLRWPTVETPLVVYFPAQVAPSTQPEIHDRPFFANVGKLMGQ